MKKLIAILGIIAIIGLVLFMAVQAHAMDVTLVWDANVESDLAGYKVYYGTSSGGPYNGAGASGGNSPIVVPLNSLANQSLPEYAVNNLPNATYYFVLTAYDTEGLESGYSNQVTVSPPIIQYQLVASVTGGNGTISPTSGTYNSGTSVTLTATPNAGYRVLAWTGTANDTLKTTMNTVTMNANRTVTVAFELIPPTQYHLTATVVGGNGTVSPASGDYNAGTTVTVTATPAAGYRVKSWTGTNNDSSTATTNTVTMTAAKTVTVTFELIPTAPAAPTNLRVVTVN